MAEEKINLTVIAQAIHDCTLNWKKPDERHDPNQYARLPQLREDLLATTEWVQISAIQSEMIKIVFIEGSLPFTHYIRVLSKLVDSPDELKFYFLNAIRGKFPTSTFDIITSRAYPVIPILAPIMSAGERVVVFKGVTSREQLVELTKLFNFPRTQVANEMLSKLLKKLTSPMAEEFSHITMDVCYSDVYRRIYGLSNTTADEDREQILHVNKLRSAAIIETTRELADLGYTVKVALEAMSPNMIE